jgi:hypothetical protein
VAAEWFSRPDNAASCRTALHATKGIILNPLTRAAEGAIARSAAALASMLVCTSVLANDVDPFGFEKEHFIASKSRAEVVADLEAAQATGQLPIPGELGARFVDVPSAKSRAQVVAETLEAARLGLLTYGELGPKQPTPAQERQIELAGMRAAANATAAKPTPGQSGS